MFLDEAEVEFQSGKGGSGAVSFHREKHVPRGGPNGADGGRGGDVILVADRSKRTLYDFRLQPKYVADSGSHAVGNKRGKDGKTIKIKVPIGTTITNRMTGELVADLKTHGSRYTVCKGGRGGFGNFHYVSSVRQVPNFAQKGEPGERLEAKLELKLLADVGLIGLPNAGKSTLIATISAAKPKIADYPFTTIIPNLGVVSAGDTTFVVADLPGLIPGASEGKGLGHRFLKHVERCRLLVHLVDCFPIDDSDPMANYTAIEEELHRYSPDLFARPRLIALNKADLLSKEDFESLLSKFSGLGPEVHGISGVTRQGVDALVFAVAKRLEESIPEEEPEEEIVLVPKNRPATEWHVEETDVGFVVIGEQTEKMVAMTDMSNEDALRYLHRRLERMGVIDALREAGATEGATVQIGDMEFAFSDEQ